MNFSTIKNIEIETRKILSKYEITEVPVLVEDIAKKMGIKISYAPSVEYSGMLIRKDGEQALMGVNSTEPKTRMRFTIAHEIAHFIFDKKTAVSIDYRNNGNILDKSPEEKRADLFAANLLMPKKWLRLDVEKISQESFSKDHIAELARKYGVSAEAMTYRLINLNLITGTN